jgi:hypothetical protein
MANRETKERDRNKYAANCLDCNASVNAGEGRLYRHRGANLTGRLSRSSPRRGSKFVYVIRCESCYLAHDKPKPTDDSYQSSTIYAAGYAYACGYYD